MTAESVPLYNPNDGLTGRDGGPYLDQEEMRIAEERRAIVEGRKPDYKNLQPTAGIQLRTAADIIHHGVHNVNLPSQSANFNDRLVSVVEGAAKDKDTPFAAADKINKSEVDRQVKDEEERQNENDDVFSEDNSTDEDDDFDLGDDVNQ